VRKVSFFIAVTTTVLLIMIFGVSLVAAGGGPAITLEKSVSTLPNTCGTDGQVTVNEPTVISYCFRVTNTGDVALDNQTLVDSQLGTIYLNENISLAPGESYQVITSTTVNVTTMNVATATASSPYVPTVSDTDSAVVIVDEIPTVVSLNNLAGDAGTTPLWRSLLIMGLAAGAVGLFRFRRR
jgi:hypothetical protein